MIGNATYTFTYQYTSSSWIGSMRAVMQFGKQYSKSNYCHLFKDRLQIIVIKKQRSNLWPHQTRFVKKKHFSLSLPVKCLFKKLNSFQGNSQIAHYQRDCNFFLRVVNWWKAIFLLSSQYFSERLYFVNYFVPGSTILNFNIFKKL